MDKASLKIMEPKGDPRQPGDEIASLEFHFNPKDYKVTMQAGWHHEPSKAPKPPEFTGVSPRTLTFEMFFDASESAKGDVSKSVEILFSCMVPTKKSVSDNMPCPPFIMLMWGKGKTAKILFTAYMKSANADFTLFRADGTPIRAVCSVTLEEYQLAVPAQNPTSGGLSARRSRQVIAGDTLASVAYQEYGSANVWRALADANGIDDPLRLRPGQRLLVPPREEAAALA